MPSPDAQTTGTPRVFPPSQRCSTRHRPCRRLREGAGIVGTEWRAEHLDGGEAAEVDLFSEVDGPHATGTEPAQHPVPPGEHLADPVARQALAFRRRRLERG